MFIIKGNILYSETPRQLCCVPQGYLVCEEGKVAGVYSQLPQQYSGVPIKDYGDSLITPGLVDLHLHAPQFAFRGLGMDLELLEWLDTQTFPEEAKYSDEEYARRAYQLFVEDMRKGATTRACVFATRHVPATLLLMDMLDKSGLVTMVGKVNMDRNGTAGLQEESAEQSLQDTRSWLQQTKGRYARTSPILTPRFIPSCSDELMRGLAQLQQETGLPVQSHLSENLSEVDWVKELCPNADGYADAYHQFSMFGGEGCPTIMAHCVHPQGQEIELMRQMGVYVAHCPGSNANLSSGVAPVRKYMDEGVHIGLGTDIAGGFSSSVFRTMSDAIQHSKLRWRLVDESLAPITVPEAFYLGTKGGGAFFGKVGSFEEGYEFDALVLDDTNLPAPTALTPLQQLERMIYLGDDRNVKAKYVQGSQIL